VLNRTSISFATAQLPQRKNQSMFAPSHTSSQVVRVPKTASHSVLYTSSFEMSSGTNVPSGSASTISSPVASTSPRRVACPNP
jgi:hypothetical protein